MKNLVKKAIVIFLTLAVVFGLVYLNTAVREDAKVLATVPKNGADNVALDAAGRISFNRTVEVSRLEVVVSPEVPLRLESTVEKRSVVLSFQDKLDPNTTYSVAVSGPKVENYSWIFTTGDDLSFPPPTTDTDELGGQGSADFSEAEQQYYRENPLLRHTPAQTEFFKIQRIEKKKARVYLYGEDKEAAKTQVYLWLEDRGIKAEEIDFEWRGE